jgi:hypothetical protein
VLDRFPTLKFGFFEVGIGWIPWLLDRLEMAYDARTARGKRRNGVLRIALITFISRSAPKTWLNESAAHG